MNITNEKQVVFFKKNMLFDILSITGIIIIIIFQLYYRYHRDVSIKKTSDELSDLIKEDKYTPLLSLLLKLISQLDSLIRNELDFLSEDIKKTSMIQ